MGEPHVFVNIHPIPSFCRHKSFMKGYEAIHDAIRRNDVFFLRRYLKERAQKKEAIEESLQKLEGQYYSAVNLSGDPLLSVLISYRKTELANKLLEDMDEESLLEANLQGNTALHVAAAVGNKMMGVADRLIRKNKELLNTRNKDNETPLLKAALHGQRNIFWMMYERGDRDAIIDVKRKDGANVLHCAIMGNAPRLALEIAESFPHLRRRRNAAAVTPLQLMVTIPGAFKSKLEIGPLDSFIYNCIPFNEGDGRGSGAASAIENAYDLGLPVAENQQDEENPQLHKKTSSPPNYGTVFNLFKLPLIAAGWAKLLILVILKLMFPRIKYLENQKKHHMETLALIDCLAGDVEYWSFISLGKTGQFGESRSFNIRELPELDEPFEMEEDKDKEISDAALQRWNDSPLITGARLGLYEYVNKILEVYPQSINILDVQGRNIIQVAIPLGSKKIFDLVASKLGGRNPLLPSRLLYARDDMNNTILHYAAEVTVDEDVAGPLQMLKDLQWFEKVEKLMPRDLRYSRNAEEKTAQECFSEKHKTMARKGKKQLTQLGQTCSGLVAAFVFASSFSISCWLRRRSRWRQYIRQGGICCVQERIRVRIILRRHGPGSVLVADYLVVQRDRISAIAPD
ncbi:uncharacterized protein LOC110019182 [Phalaenopsis equestris]|uniref:uncharacterized protein LOC110019182 n=1 Tax=Phalaenopsis equestris TaxID=78828 RepID=UPI0009E31CDE|nr:uncharacterized protein LOC110019182 [Phalaenopsis equestris]